MIDLEQRTCILSDWAGVVDGKIDPVFWPPQFAGALFCLKASERLPEGERNRDEAPDRELVRQYVGNIPKETWLF
jgi:hypothetical protein